MPDQLSTLPPCPATPNDLCAFKEGDGWMVGIIEEITNESMLIRWGDSERAVPFRQPKIIFPRQANQKCIGTLIGKQFSSFDALIVAHAAAKGAGKC